MPANQEQKRTAIALVTALFNGDTMSYSRITHPMDREELRQTFNAVVALFVAASTPEERATMLERMQGYGLYVAADDDE